MKIIAYIHSLKNRATDENVLGEAEIVEWFSRDGQTEVVAVVSYNGVKCRGIFNHFTGRYYLDDIYSTVKD